MENNKGSELREISHLSLVITLIAFSTVLVILNVTLAWEKWTIPLCIAAIPVCITMHVIKKPQDQFRIYIYSAILLMEMFYYCSNVETIFDSTPVIVVLLVVFSLTREKVIMWLGIIVGYAGMLYHLADAYFSIGLNTDRSNIVRTIWHFLLVAIAGMIIDRFIYIVSAMSKNYEDRIRVLEGASKSASDFLANVSHEIRTPINAVIGLSGVCIEKEKDGIIREDLMAIKQAGNRVAEQISDILDYSEIDMDNLAVNEEDYMLSSVLNDLVNQIRPIKPDELELVIDVDPAIPSVMCTDVGKLKKILWHLVANGLKYTKEGGVYVRIYSIKEAYGINLCFEVKDTGIGMTPDELERISERFYQANSGRTRSTSGLGLGMSIVSGFVSVLGGFMTIESKRDKGTTVHISIPQKVIDPSVCMSVSEPDKLALGAFLHFEKFENANVREYYSLMLRDIVTGLKVQMHKVDTIDNLRNLVSSMELTHLFVGDKEYETAPEYIEELSKKILVVLVANDDYKLPPGSKIRQMRKPFYCFPVIGVLNSRVDDLKESEGRLMCPGVRALIVDDEPMNLTVGMGIFKRYGMVVSTASSGMESIEMCRANEYDIVFMDHMMPGMDGVEAMKRIRTDAGRDKKDLPVVALTANAVSTAREMFIREGFDGFVSKPVELTELERVLRKVLPKSLITVVRDEEAGADSTGSGGSGTSGGGSDAGTSGTSGGGSDADAKTSGNSLSEDKSIKSEGAGKKEENIPADDKYKILKEAGIDVSAGLKYSQNDEEFYLTLLEQYKKDAGKKKSNMAGFLSDGQIGDYTIVVHSLKSTSKMIGVMDLFEKARKLEEASKEGDKAYIDANHEIMIEEYDKMVDAISKFIDKEKPSDEKADETHKEGDPDQDEVLEFGASESDEILEFGASNEDEVLEFEPEGKGGGR